MVVVWRGQTAGRRGGSVFIVVVASWDVSWSGEEDVPEGGWQVRCGGVTGEEELRQRYKRDMNR